MSPQSTEKKCWLYHPELGGRIFSFHNPQEVQAKLDEGWTTSPGIPAPSAVAAVVAPAQSMKQAVERVATLEWQLQNANNRIAELEGEVAKIRPSGELESAQKRIADLEAALTAVQAAKNKKEAVAAAASVHPVEAEEPAAKAADTAADAQ